MTYIDLLNDFWRLNKEYAFTPNEKAVYFALLNKANELRWKNPFNHSNGYLALDSGMSEPAMAKARNTLKQRGLIEFKPGTGRRNNTIYQIKGISKFDLSDAFSGTLSNTLSNTLSSENGLYNIREKIKIVEEDKEGDSDINNTMLKTKKTREKKNENPPPEQKIEGSIYGDGVLHYRCVEYHKQNPDKYPLPFYENFLQYWTAQIQKGHSKGAELWRDQKAFSLGGRLSTSWSKFRENYGNTGRNGINGGYDPKSRDAGSYIGKTTAELNYLHSLDPDRVEY